MPSSQIESLRASARQDREISPVGNQSNSWHRTRSRSRTLGDAKPMQRPQPGDDLEHLVRAILEYALQLFVNGSSKNRSRDLDMSYNSQPETCNQQDSSRQQQRPDGKSQSDTNINEIARLVLTQVVKYGIRKYVKNGKKQPRMPGPSRQNRGRPARRGGKEESAEYADAPSGRTTPAWQSQDSCPRTEAENLPRQKPALPSQYSARLPLLGRYHEPTTPPSSPRGSLPARPSRYHPPQSRRPDQDVQLKLWPLPARSRSAPLASRPVQHRELVGDTSQSSPYLFIAALEELMSQLRATDDLVYRTLHRPSVVEEHDGCNTRRAVLAHAADLHRAIDRASADTRQVREMVDAFFPVG